MRNVVDEYGEAIVTALLGMSLIGVALASLVGVTINI